MRKIIPIVLLILFIPYICSAGVQDMLKGVIERKNAVTTVNFCNDASAVGCWFMNAADGGDGSQAEPDRTSNGNNLAVSSSDTIPSSNDVPTGYSGHSRDFENNEIDYLTIDDGTELDINGANATVSMVAWVKPESTINGAYYAILAKHYSTNGYRQYALTLKGTGTDTYEIDCFISSDGNTSTTNTSTTINYAVGEWKHIGCVSNDTDMRIYVNGSLASTPTAFTAGIFNGGSPFRIGAYGNNANPFDGLIDEVAVFSRALSSTEVGAIYTNGISGNKGGSE